MTMSRDLVSGHGTGYIQVAVADEMTDFFKNSEEVVQEFVDFDDDDLP